MTTIQRRKLAGLCADCSRPATATRRCDACAETHRQRERARYAAAKLTRRWV